jgi:hypothetical protein
MRYNWLCLSSLSLFVWLCSFFHCFFFLFFFFFCCLWNPILWQTSSNMGGESSCKALSLSQALESFLITYRIIKGRQRRLRILLKSFSRARGRWCTTTLRSTWIVHLSSCGIAHVIVHTSVSVEHMDCAPEFVRKIHWRVYPEIPCSAGQPDSQPERVLMLLFLLTKCHCSDHLTISDCGRLSLWFCTGSSVGTCCRCWGTAHKIHLLCYIWQWLQLEADY